MHETWGQMWKTCVLDFERLVEARAQSGRCWDSKIDQNDVWKSIVKLTGFLIKNKLEHLLKMGSRGTPKTIKKRAQKNNEKYVKKRHGSCASAAVEMVGGGEGSPYRAAPQDNKYKLSQAN